jgi:hypothetical protein
VTTREIIELALAILLIGGGIWSYRRGGTQGAVILMIVGLIVAVHALGLMEYRPSRSELGQ